MSKGTRPTGEDTSSGPPVRARVPSDWWVPLYDDLLAESLLVRDGDESETLAFLEDELLLGRRAKPARIFDQCCGIGSLAIPLALRGHNVLGVDQAEGYIERARITARHAGSSASFVAADAFEFVAQPACDAAFNWWTSYGYAGSEARNHRMLRRAYESLVPGGRFALDVPNLAGVLRHFDEDRTDRRETPLGTIEMRRESRVDLEAGRLLKRWTFQVDGTVRANRNTSLALAMPHDHMAALRSVGFEIAAAYASTTRDPITIDSRRCILVAEKSA